MCDTKKSYYAIIPASVRYDKKLTMSARMLYGELTALSNEKGFCFASNNYFAELYEVTPQAISKWINILAERGYIKLEYIYNGKEVKERHIFILDVSTNIDTVSTDVSEVSTKVDGGINKGLTGYQQKIKDNNTYNNKINNTHNNDVPSYIKEPYKNTKLENSDLLHTCHELILEHNSKHPIHSISINKTFEYFKQTYNQGMAISRLNQMASVDEIVEALKNYLLVANSKTWRNTFSITGFCNSYVDFTKEFFDMRKFINIPRDKVKCVIDQLSKALISKQFFRRDTFIYHREDWFNLGMPEGEDLVNLVNKWLKEDEQKNINYAIVNDKWEEEK